MKNYKNSGRRDSNKSFPAKCDKCGKDCTLPFKPTNSKPVYCRDCYKKENGSSDRPRIKAKFDRKGNRDESYKGGYSKFSEDTDNKEIINRLTHIEKKLDKLLSHYER